MVSTSTPETRGQGDDNSRERTMERPKTSRPPQSPTSPSRRASQRKPATSPVHFDFGQVIGPRSLSELGSCPCCNQSLHEQEQQSLRCPHVASKKTGSLMDDDESIDSDDEGFLPGGKTDDNLAFQPKRILVEGWLHKKGTGKDWLSSRAWKPRWTRLVMAQVEGYDVDVPLLMMYWYVASPTPSTVIVLDSTVVFPVDLDDKSRWDAFRFDVRNARTVATSVTANRTFSAPKKARDAWMYAISQALLMYEKAHDRVRKASILVNEARRVSPTYDEMTRSGDRFAVTAQRSTPRRSRPAGSPPTSPASQRKPEHKQAPRRPLPRPANLDL